MSYSLKIKEKAINLRKKGYSIKEIASFLKIAQSTSSLWVRNIILNQKALQRIKQRKIYGQYKSSQQWKVKRKKNQILAHNKAKLIISQLNLNKENLTLICSILFWAEGAKHLGQIKFINSDPVMITTFLKLFRSCFIIDEKKLRAIIHIHEYHNDKKIKKYWSTITNIPISQFYNSYLKPHTGKRKRINYKGCISVNYYDAKLARELHAIYNTFASKFLGV
ncbi:MAG: hypothetical protein ABIJ43_04785 [Candidatus Beckwithbacteria bacterium]|nr:hypothetical protein [Patescibacteria group bacterium]